MEPSITTPDRLTLLIVEDSEDLRQQMKWALATDYEVREAGDRQEALRVVQEEPVHLALMDLGLPPDPDGATEGLATLEAVLKRVPQLKVMMVTGNTERRHAFEAVALGAYDFLEKPVELEVLRIVLQRAEYLVRLEQENSALRAQDQSGGVASLIGNSLAMQNVVDMIRRVAKSDFSILITGESGTGKELVARALHQLGECPEGPFVAINCGAIPENLMESELFGHEKGAFTGAHARRKGKIESAHHGTLFLDEIGELPPNLQVKLLRVLQEKCIERVGGRESIPVEARVLAATNVDLQKAMEEGRFREDLYYRLNTVTLAVPPLRDRGADAIILAEHFLQQFSREAKKKILGLTKEAKIALEQYPWPGNVRELQNRIKRAVAMTDGVRVTPEDLQLTVSQPSYSGQTLREARESVERDLIQRTLEKTRGNITRAAAELGVSRPTLHELISRYRLK